MNIKINFCQVVCEGGWININKYLYIYMGGGGGYLLPHVYDYIVRAFRKIYRHTLLSKPIPPDKLYTKTKMTHFPKSVP